MKKKSRAAFARPGCCIRFTRPGCCTTGNKYLNRDRNGGILKQKFQTVAKNGPMFSAHVCPSGTLQYTMTMLTEDIILATIISIIIFTLINILLMQNREYFYVPKDVPWQEKVFWREDH